MQEPAFQEGNSKEWLKPWQFKPGQSGNPSGRPKGTVSLKQYAKKYLQELTEEEKLEFMEGLSKDIIWEMAEGKPHNTTDITTLGKALPTPIYGGQSLQNQGHESDTKDIQPQKED